MAIVRRRSQEVFTKFRSGKQPEFAGIANDVAAVISAHRFIQLPITTRHAHGAANLPSHHRDLTDRFLIGQALVEGMTIVTVDSAFAGCAAKLLW